ncbi:MAG: NYN domain-containing protein [Vulcanibacillus sp.]
MEEILIVDGYNIIGAWTELRHLKEKGLLSEARDDLLTWLGEYKAFSGRTVIVVFDAHQIKGKGKKYFDQRVIIYYTEEDETADELIEKLVVKLNHKKKRIYVATSDYTEQRVVFGQGALRISARELEIEKEALGKSITNKVNSSNDKINSNIFSNLDEEMKKIFEKWRRSK